ncbi:MAG TPA: response regulator [Bryobacteraceae bacterium]|jgi:PAS domain S-box-containing protein|nr:response regulator [Bryobacteraceae bacterium]
MSSSNIPQIPQSEDALRQALQDYAVLTLDARGTITEWSDGAERTFGWLKSEVVGRSFSLLFTPEDQGRNGPVEELSRAARGEASEDERWHMRKDGSRIFITGIVRALLAPDGTLTGYSKVARDITAHKLAQMQRDALLAKEQSAREEAEHRWKYLEQIFENLPAAVGLVRLPEQTYVFANRMLRGIAGDRPLIGQTLGDARVGLNAEDLAILDTVATTGQVYATKERVLDLRTESGTDRKYFDFVYHLMGTVAGAYDAILVFGIDVTERIEHRRMEERLREADKLESVGYLAGGIAHDFNNLLTGIIGNINLAQELTEAGSPIRELLGNALQGSERAASLTKQMLAYAGKGHVLIRAVDLSAVVRETVRLVGSATPDNVRLEMVLARDLPSIRADEAQLQHVVMNLIINAAEATAEKGGKVTVKTGVQEIDDAAAAKPCDVGRLTPGRYVLLEIQDTGMGIDPAIRPNLFDPFFTTKFTGRGLGLAAVSGIVRVLNGAVRVDSAPGLGATFYVWLPAAGPGAEAGPGPQEKEYDPILVVDDEDIVRKTTELMLRSRGYKVVVAEDGPQAVDLVRKLGGRLTLVLLDMTMPQMSGDEVFRRLKAMFADIPVIVCSGFGEAEAIKRFGGLGVAAFIQKPFTLEKLTEKIEEVVKHRS